MLKSFLRSTWRTLLRQKTYSAINIAGLGIGLAASILIGLWVSDELSYDRFHTHASDLYRIVENQHYDNGADFPVAVTPGPLTPALKAAFPQIEAITRLHFTIRTIRYKDKTFRENDVALVDSTFLSMFSFPLLKGNPRTALNGINNIVLTARMAKKYFGDEDPLGKNMTLPSLKDEEFTVTGVLADPPPQSHLSDIDVLLPYRYAERNFPWVNTMGNNVLYTYVQLKKGTDPALLNKRLKKYLPGNANTSPTDLLLQRLTAIHLHSNFTADIGGNGSIQYVYIFSGIALLVIIIACINFMNLATARYERRAKEVGVRKVIGADRKSLIIQFLGESLFMSILALAIALGLITFLLPAFNDLSAKTLSLASLTPQQVISILAITLVTGLAAGIYPALFLSSFKPVSVLKAGRGNTGKGISFRNILVITQFVISVFLIIGTLTIGNQLHFIRDKRLGFDKDNIVVLPSTQSFDAFKAQLLQTQGVSALTESNSPLTNVTSSRSDYTWEGKNPTSNILFHNLAVGYDFFETFHIRVVQGRGFSKNFSSDTAAYIINEEALRQMKLKDPIGKKLSNGTIIGVAQDFNFKSIHSRIEPLVLRCSPQECWITFARIAPGNLSSKLASIEETYRRFNPNGAYQYSFLDDQFTRLYNTEQRTSTLFQWFAALAIFISCLGLFGLVTYAAERRTREIGIRKVLGATEKSIVFMLSQQFLRLVLIALVIAIPLAAWAMNRWLQDFAYRISLQWWVFALGGLLALAIALVTVGIQAARASLANPVKSLRTE